MSADDVRHPRTLHERPASGPLEAVIFDWGGTLTPWHTIDLGQQWRIFAREIHGVPIDSDEVSQEDLDRAKELGDRLHAVEEVAWKRVREDRRSTHLDDILAEAGINARDDRHHVALAAYRRFWEPHTHTDPLVRPLFEGLRERGLRVGVLSNTIWSGEFHREIFERDGVLDLIDGDVYSSELHVVKPHAEAFEAACDALGVKPTNAAYVGDRLFEDVLGSQEVGMRAIWIPHSDIPADQQVTVDATPDGVAESLLDVLDIVDGWLAAT